MFHSNNPLLSAELLPLFNKILPAHIEPAIQTLLDTNRLKIKNLLKSGDDQVYTWESLVEPLNKIENNLSNAWSTITHLSSVMDSPAIREAHDAMLPKLTEYYTELGQNESLYQAFLSIASGSVFNILTPAQQKVILDELRDFKLSGIDLAVEQKDQLKVLNTRLSDLGSQFEHNVLDATQGWSLHITNAIRLKGIPASTLQLWRQAAEQKNLSGWLLNLGYASYHAVLCYAEDRALREEIYEAYATRASDVGFNAGKWDNGPVMIEILELRQQLAILLGFRDFAEYSLETKMAKIPQKVMSLLSDLAVRAQPKAAEELEALKQFAHKEYSLLTIESWDIAFLSEQLCQMKYHISEEQLRSYFPINKVLEGLFTIVGSLFGIRIEELFDFDTWHESVRLFVVYDKTGKERGKFFLDLYARENKREGAWVSDCRTRVKWQEGTIQIPVAYVVTNIAPAVDQKQPLLRHDDVITLFHEFGHCLHHILSTVDYYDVSGHHGVQWDAIELPSQLMENWCWEREALDLITEHVDTHSSLPEKLFQNLKASKTFLSGLFLVRQLEFALIDFTLHQQPLPISSMLIQTIVNTIRKQVAVVTVPHYHRFQHTFTHVFAGGYAAGYYSYLWAEVLSSDVYEKFKEGGILNSSVGQCYLTTILEKGGSKEAMDLFIDFQGREPTVDALLKQLALI